LYLAKKGILEASVTSAHELSDSVIAQLEKAITKEMGKEIQLETKVNADILGGLILRVGDMQYNGSVASELQRLRLDFKKNLYVADF
jgi:F-type H+-transporting ATPase subunit delta